MRHVCEVNSRADANFYSEYVFQRRQHPYHELLQSLAGQHPRLCIDAPVEHGKTTQFDIVRTTWTLGKNPSAMIGIFSNSGVIPERALRSIGECILANERYHQVFPEIEVRKHTQSEIWIRRPAGSMHPSIIAMGIGGSIIGSRLTLLILDDILDFANTWSENERKKMWELLNSTVLNRLLANGRLIDIGTPWHVEDARHKLRRMFGYTYVHFDAEDGQYYRFGTTKESREIPGGAPGTLWNEIYIDPNNGNVYGWPPERLAEKKAAMPPHEYARQYRCIALSGSMAIFPVDTMEYAKSLGRQFFFVGKKWFREEAFDRTRVVWRPQDDPAIPVITGIDLAIEKKDGADLTAMYTASLESGMKLPLEIRAGQMEGPEILRACIAILRRYPGHRGFRVETNAAQKYIAQFMNEPDIMRALGADEKLLQLINVRAHNTTGQYKADPVIGIRGMAMYFSQGKWPIPADDQDRCPGLFQDWYDAMIAFDPTGHPNDILMASWLCAEEARTFGDGASTSWGRFGMHVPGMMARG